MTWAQSPWAALTAQLIINIFHLSTALLDQEWEEVTAFHSKKVAEMRIFTYHHLGNHWGPTGIVFNVLYTFLISFSV